MAVGGIFRPLVHEAFPLAGTSVNVPNDLSNVTGTGASALDPTTPSGGAMTSKPVIAEAVPTGLTGSITNSFFDDYYNQVWVVPSSLDFGAIGSESSKTFMVWNAYWRTSQTLASVLVSSGEGVSLAGRAVPATFKPLESTNYTVTVAANGPAMVATVYRLTFSNGQQFDLPITGTRAKLWSTLPNWSSGYKITYEFKTEIFTSRSGREQRIAHRMTPRKTLSHSVLLTADKLRNFNALMWSWQDRAFVLPEVTRKTFSQSDMPPSGEHLDVLDVPDWLKAGITVILDDNAGTKEVRAVESISGQRVAFKSSTQTPWPVGTIVYYAVSGYFDTSMATSRLTSTVATLNLTFNVAPGSEPVVDNGTPILTIGGREIFDKRPNWSNNVDVTHQHDVDEVDYGYGLVSRFSPVKFGTMLRQHTYLARNIAEAEAVLQFFSRNFGQQGEFYAPTWEHDVAPKIAAGPSTTSLRIAGRNFYDAYASSTVNRGLAVRFKDGTMLYRLIQSIDLVSDGSGGTDSLITITQTWGREVSNNTIEYISWLLLWRFASDVLTLEFASDTVAQFQVAMRSLETLTPES